MNSLKQNRSPSIKQAWILKLEPFEQPNKFSNSCIQSTSTKIKPEDSSSNSLSDQATTSSAELVPETVSNPKNTEEGKDEESTKFTVEWVLSHLDIHGLSTWVETNKAFAKVTWGSVILLAFFALCWGVFKSVHDYRNNPILTTYSVVPQKSMEFPEIYICPTNFINQTFVLENGVDLYWAGYYWQSVLNGTEDILAEKSTVWEVLVPGLDEQSPKSKEPKDFQEFIMSLGYQIDEVFNECKFGNRNLDCKSIVEEIFDKDHGKCFLIRKQFNQTVSGIGLSLVLNIHTDESPNLIKYHPPLFDGIYLSISHKFNPALFQKLLVSPGLFTKVALTATKIMLINVRDQKCVDIGDRSYFEIVDMDYSMEACQMECVQKLIKEKCKCLLAVDQKYLRTTNWSICRPEIMQDCVMEAVKKYEPTISSCNSHCWPPCEIWEYKTDLSSLRFPSKALQKKKDGVLGAQITKWMNDYILLDIAFKNLHYTEISQSASMTFDTFISNLGGQMGIWLGASLLTVVQASMLVGSFCIGKLILKQK